MSIFAACLICIVAVELFIRLPLARHVKCLSHYTARSSKVITSPNISDHWKEKVLKAYSARIAIASIKLFITMLAAFVPLTAMAIFLDWLRSSNYSTLAYLSTLEGLAFAAITSSAYYYVRKKVFH